jgi:hypothetical protein
MRLITTLLISAFITFGSLDASFAQDAYGGTGGDASSLRNVPRYQ